MIRSSSRAMRLLVSGIVVVLPGCADDSANAPPPGSSAAPVGAPGPSGAAAGPASNPKLKEIMIKIGRGPQALQGSLSSALKQPETAWDAVQAKAHEYATLTADMAKHEPVKGTKESWGKLTAAFTQAAAELDTVAKARDREKTVAAVDSLGNSCQGCHREHRVMGPPGGFPGGGFPGGPRGGPAPGQAAPPPGSTQPAGESKPN